MSERDELAIGSIIHLHNPERGQSYCGEPVTLIEAAGDARPICQACHRGAMKTVRRGWCPCASNRPQDCKPELWPLSARHGLSTRWPRTITKTEELDALPNGSVIRTAGTDEYEPRVVVKLSNWNGSAEWDVADCEELSVMTGELDDLPATVLWEPR